MPSPTSVGRHRSPYQLPRAISPISSNEDFDHELKQKVDELCKLGVAKNQLFSCEVGNIVGLQQVATALHAVVSVEPIFGPDLTKLQNASIAFLDRLGPGNRILTSIDTTRYPSASIIRMLTTINRFSTHVTLNRNKIKEGVAQLKIPQPATKVPILEETPPQSLQMALAYWQALRGILCMLGSMRDDEQDFSALEADMTKDRQELWSASKNSQTLQSTLRKDIEEISEVILMVEEELEECERTRNDIAYQQEMLLAGEIQDVEDELGSSRNLQDSGYAASVDCTPAAMEEERLGMERRELFIQRLHNELCDKKVTLKHSLKCYEHITEYTTLLQNAMALMEPLKKYQTQYLAEIQDKAWNLCVDFMGATISVSTVLDATSHYLMDEVGRPVCKDIASPSKAQYGSDLGQDSGLRSGSDSARSGGRSPYVERLRASRGWSPIDKGDHLSFRGPNNDGFQNPSPRGKGDDSPRNGKGSLGSPLGRMSSKGQDASGSPFGRMLSKDSICTETPSRDGSVGAPSTPRGGTSLTPGRESLGNSRSSSTLVSSTFVGGLEWDSQDMDQGITREDMQAIKLLQQGIITSSTSLLYGISKLGLLPADHNVVDICRASSDKEPTPQAHEETHTSFNNTMDTPNPSTVAVKRRKSFDPTQYSMILQALLSALPALEGTAPRLDSVPLSIPKVLCDCMSGCRVKGLGGDLAPIRHAGTRCSPRVPALRPLGHCNSFPSEMSRRRGGSVLSSPHRTSSLPLAHLPIAPMSPGPLTFADSMGRMGVPRNPLTRSVDRSSDPESSAEAHVIRSPGAPAVSVIQP